MAGAPIVEIREPGRPPRRVVVDRAIEVGRECDGEVVSDEGVSRRHLRLVPSPVALSVVDLGSRNGTLLNGVPITGRGVIVNDRMETSVPGVFAAGDVAEHGGQLFGLWPIAAKQGEAAALNALGGDASLTAEVPATILKGVGLDLFSVGRSAVQPGDQVVVDEDPDPAAPSYRRLVLSEGRAAGGIVLGNHPEVVAAVTAAVKNGAEVSPAIVAELRRGDWTGLKDAGRVSAPAGA